MKKELLICFAILSSSSAQASLPAELKSSLLLTGKPISIATHATDKKGLVVTFLSAKCPCSDSHIPELKKLSREFPEFRFVVVHSNADESSELSQSYFKRADLPIEVLQDDKGKIADEFKAFKTPHVFVLNPQGEIVYKGGMTNSSNAAEADQHYLAAALTDLKQGKKVAVAETRTLGCAIAREKNQNVW